MIKKTGNRKIWNEFIDFLKYDKKMKENTMLSYERDINAFLDYCKEDGVEAFCDTTVMFEKYMEDLKNAGKSASTVSRNIASLRSFFRFLRDRGYTEVNPTHGMKYAKKQASEDRSEILTTDEIDSLISAANGDSFKALRDKAIIETLYACGLKVSELINLKTDDLFLNDGYIKIESAGSSRYVPIYKGASKAVRNYIAKGRCQVTGDKKNTFLFLNRDGKPVTRQGLWKILKTYGEKACIKKEVTPHLIRRSMAVHLVENGAGIFDVKDILGHKNITLTKNYVKDFKPSVISAYVKAHPKA